MKFYRSLQRLWDILWGISGFWLVTFFPPGTPASPPEEEDRLMERMRKALRALESMPPGPERKALQEFLEEAMVELRGKQRRDEWERDIQK